jgi:mRNA interferase RelE/StbE
MYQVLLHPLANRALESLDPAIQQAMRKALRTLADSPERGKHLTHSRFWSLRVGDYRAIYEIMERDQSVVILFIGHRKNVYTDFSKLHDRW